MFAFNEAENIPSVLREVRAWLDAHEPGARIVFVDDGSTDGTADSARAALADTNHVVVRHETNRGIGAALKSGVIAAQSRWITFLPADGQVPPQAVGILRAAAVRDGADIVLSVYDHRDDGLDRKVLSWGVRALIRLVHGVKLSSDGPYLFRSSLFVPEDLPPDTFFLNFEFLERVIGTSPPHVRTQANRTTSRGNPLRIKGGYVNLLYDHIRRPNRRTRLCWLASPILFFGVPPTLPHAPRVCADARCPAQASRA
ncbi:MAG: glycosyltransferase family 2 protein [Sandaracinaceae bacterium]|nr:glycosyltransferase family 2 protein [Sandaracinaceae bacterium]